MAIADWRSGVSCPSGRGVGTSVRTGGGLRYRAFISYSHDDARAAAWLHRALESYRVPRRLRLGPGGDPALPERMAPVFRDREELASAQSLGPQIESALAESEALIVICSPAAARSRWVEQEILAFQRSRSQARVHRVKRHRFGAEGVG